MPRGRALCGVRAGVPGQRPVPPSAEVESPIPCRRWGPAGGQWQGDAGREGSWPAQPCRKQSVCTSALAEAGCETSCPSFQSEGAYDVILPRATANSQVTGSANSTLRAEDMYAAQSHQAASPLRDGKNSQVFRNPYVWD